MKNLLYILTTIAFLTSCSASKYYFHKRIDHLDETRNEKTHRKEKTDFVTGGISEKTISESNPSAEDTMNFPVKTTATIPVLKTEILTGYSTNANNVNSPFFKTLMQKAKAPFKRKRMAKQKLIGNSQGDGGVLFLLAILGAIALIIFVHPLVGIGAGIIIIIIAITIAIVGAIAALIVAIVGGLIGAIIN